MLLILSKYANLEKKMWTVAKYAPEEKIHLLQSRPNFQRGSMFRKANMKSQIASFGPFVKNGRKYTIEIYTDSPEIYTHTYWINFLYKSYLKIIV